MHISGISAAFPKRQVSNSNIVDLIRANSEQSFEGDLEKTLKTIAVMLKKTGTKTRYWLGKDDNAFEYTEKAIMSALDKAQLNIDDIDLLMFASVDKRVIEPGMSFLTAKALGMKTTQCFDITEGCGGWVRATQLAQLYLNAGIHTNILIVTAEYGIHDGSMSKNLLIEKHEDLEWALAAYTVGEGSTATVLTADPDKQWEHVNHSLPQLADLCLVPCYENDPQVMRMKDVNLAGKGLYRFVSYSQKMHEQSFELVRNMLANNSVNPEDMDMFIPHTQSINPWKQIQKSLDKEIPFSFLLPEYGNLVNNSMPAAIALAVDGGRIKRGDKICGLMTAAGMSFTIFNLVY
ncbi:MAG: hypothetical protein COB27_002850 [Moritella sp.]|uniref:3-oxoacyl-ACP synthase III family protein n=1 Tax=Moritella sp. TaxID=78556 RepID=UPI000C0E4FCD|nr:3-oxoacyl-[acyl-carrier-protein] synthase III C-terminal domain-containing protein [Moritella sp.]MBL1415806.1 hypothetical protein [Moritella sp.]